MPPVLSIVPPPHPSDRKVIDLAEWKASHMTQDELNANIERLSELARQASQYRKRIQRKKFRIVS